MTYKCLKGSGGRGKLRKTTKGTTKYRFGNGREKQQEWKKKTVSISEKVKEDEGLRVGRNLKEDRFLTRGQDTAWLTKNTWDTTHHPMNYIHLCPGMPLWVQL